MDEDKERFLCSLRWYCRRTFKNAPTSIAITMPNGDKHILSAAMPKQRAMTPDEALEGEEHVLSKLPRKGDKGMSTKQVKAACGYRSLRHVQRILKNLLRKHKVVKDGHGYRRED